MLLPLVDITEAAVRSGDATTAIQLLPFLAHLGILGPVLLRFQGGISSTGDDESLVSFMKQAANDTALHVQGVQLDNDELVTKFLDNGCHVVYFDRSNEENLQTQVLKSFPKNRVGLNCEQDVLTLAHMIDIIGRYQEVAGHFLFRIPILTDSQTLQDMAAIRQQAKVVAATGVKISFTMPVGSTPTDLATLSTFHENNINTIFHPKLVTTLPDTPIIKSCCPLSPSTLAEAEKLQIPIEAIETDYFAAYIACLRTDRPDGLFTTVVCDEHDVCLGLVYSNEQSIKTAFSERKGVYWSRSRGGLWRKGDSSGMHQTLLAVKYDCDGDALRFNVIQHGEPAAFCHLMTKTCWGPVTGIQHLQEVLIDRKKSAPVGSYTKRLFDDPDLLQKKLLEEVQD